MTPRHAFTISSNGVVYVDDMVEATRERWLNHSIDSPVDGDLIAIWRSLPAS